MRAPAFVASAHLRMRCRGLKNPLLTKTTRLRMLLSTRRVATHDMVEVSKLKLSLPLITQYKHAPGRPPDLEQNLFEVRGIDLPWKSNVV